MKLAGRVRAPDLKVRPDTRVPKNEIWFVDRQGRMVGKILNVDLRECTSGDPGVGLAEVLVPTQETIRPEDDEDDE